MDVVFLDLAKAFDKVPHTRVNRKLQKQRIGGKLKCVIESWLVNRRQRGYVRMDHHHHLFAQTEQYKLQMWVMCDKLSRTERHECTDNCP